MFYGHFCAHGRLHGPTPFRYPHAEFRTQVIVIFGPTRYQLDRGDAHHYARDGNSIIIFSIPICIKNITALRVILSIVSKLRNRAEFTAVQLGETLSTGSPPLSDPAVNSSI